MQRTELLEVEEYFGNNQKGSSAMPHKKNPVLSENLTGIARYIRSAVIPSLENIALWHERDISHSSVERLLAPDITIAMDFSLARLTQIIKEMKIYPKNMEKNLNMLGGLHKSQEILLHLTQKGASREEAYSIVQKCAMESWNKSKKFDKIVLNNNKINKYLNKKELKNIFTKKEIIDNINWIYKNKLK